MYFFNFVKKKNVRTPLPHEPSSSQINSSLYGHSLFLIRKKYVAYTMNDQQFYDNAWAWGRQLCVFFTSLAS